MQQPAGESAGKGKNHETIKTGEGAHDYKCEWVVTFLWLACTWIKKKLGKAYTFYEKVWKFFLAKIKKREDQIQNPRFRLQYWDLKFRIQTSHPWFRFQDSDPRFRSQNSDPRFKTQNSKPEFKIQSSNFTIKEIQNLVSKIQIPKFRSKIQIKNSEC